MQNDKNDTNFPYFPTGLNRRCFSLVYSFYCVQFLPLGPPPPPAYFFSKKIPKTPLLLGPLFINF